MSWEEREESPGMNEYLLLEGLGDGVELLKGGVLGTLNETGGKGVEASKEGRLHALLIGLMKDELRRGVNGKKRRKRKHTLRSTRLTRAGSAWSQASPSP